MAPFSPASAAAGERGGTNSGIGVGRAIRYLVDHSVTAEMAFWALDSIFTTAF